MPYGNRCEEIGLAGLLDRKVGEWCCMCLCCWTCTGPCKRGALHMRRQGGQKEVEGRWAGEVGAAPGCVIGAGAGPGAGTGGVGAGVSEA